MKQLFLFTFILSFCCCSVKKLQSHKQDTAIHTEYLQTDCTRYLLNSYLLGTQKLKIKQIQLSPPDSLQQQFIQSVTLLESETEQTEKSSTEIVERYEQEQQSDITENLMLIHKSSGNNTRWFDLIWVIALVLIYRFLKNKE